MLSKFLISALFLLLTFNSAAETEVARLTLSEQGQPPLTCVVYAENNGTSFKVCINDIPIASSEALVEAITQAALTFGQAFCLLERAQPCLERKQKVIFPLKTN